MSCDSALTIAEAKQLSIKHFGEHKQPRTLVWEPKVDGFRLMVRMTRKGLVAWTRGMKYTHERILPIKNVLEDILPIGTILDGELCAGYWDDRRWVNDFEYVQSVMLSLPERANELLSTRMLSYQVFDILQLEDNDVRHMPLAGRRAIVGMLEFSGPVAPLWRSHLPQIAELTQEEHDALCAIGLEGGVVKDLRSPYLDGGRGRGWYKIKATDTTDVVIMGYKEGEGKFAGMIGSIEFGQYDASGRLVQRGSCSGMDDITRMDFTKRRDEYLGHVIKIAHMGVMRDKVHFRHPQYRGLHHDKTAAMCTWNDGSRVA